MPDGTIDVYLRNITVGIVVTIHHYKFLIKVDCLSQFLRNFMPGLLLSAFTLVFIRICITSGSRSDIRDSQ